VWLASAEALAQGWRSVEGPEQAQRLANQGELVVIVYESPRPRRPGHIVVVRPSLKSAAALARDGPQIIQAGAQDHASWTAREAFGEHRGAWPDSVRFFAHIVPTPN